MTDDDKQRVWWHELDIELKRSTDLDALADAIRPPADMADQLSKAGGKLPEGALRFLQCWGWWSAGNRTPIDSLGVYGDWTYLEDDERFFPLVAPFVRAGSRAVFALSEYPDHDEFEVWEFDGRTVTRHPTEREVRFL